MLAGNLEPASPVVRDPTPLASPGQPSKPHGKIMRHKAPNNDQGEKRMDQKLSVHRFLDQKRRFTPSRRGFSLIEILVALSIIALLLGIGATVALKMTAEARREQTRAMMEGLLSANDEYKAVRQGTSISHTGDFNGQTLSSTERFVASCLQIKTCEEIMMVALNSSTSQSLERIYRNGGGSSYKSVYDRWGTELQYRQSNDQTGTGPANETGAGVANDKLPLSRDPFFASAGPDKTWGTDDDITTLER